MYRMPTVSDCVYSITQHTISFGRFDVVVAFYRQIVVLFLLFVRLNVFHVICLLLFFFVARNSDICAFLNATIIMGLMYLGMF